MIEISALCVVVAVLSMLIFNNISHINNNDMEKATIILVNEDHGATLHDEHYKFGQAFVTLIEKDTNYQWLVSSQAIAETKLQNNEADVAVIIPSDFSSRALAIDDVKPEAMQLNYLVNPQKTATNATQIKLILEEIQTTFNANLVEVYFANLLQTIDTVKERLIQMGETEKVHETIFITDILGGSVAIDQQLVTLTTTSEQLSSMLEHDSTKYTEHIQHVTEQLTTTTNYTEQYQTFLAVYQANNQTLADLTTDINIVSDRLSLEQYQENISAVETELTRLEHYFSTDLLALIDGAISNNQQTLAKLEVNSMLIKEYLATDGALANHFTEMSAILTKQLQTDEKLGAIFQTEIAETCQALGKSGAENEQLLCDKLGIRSNDNPENQTLTTLEYQILQAKLASYVKNYYGVTVAELAAEKTEINVATICSKPAQQEQVAYCLLSQNNAVDYQALLSELQLDIAQKFNAIVAVEEQMQQNIITLIEQLEAEKVALIGDNGRFVQLATLKANFHALQQLLFEVQEQISSLADTSLTLHTSKDAELILESEMITLQQELMSNSQQLLESTATMQHDAMIRQENVTLFANDLTEIKNQSHHHATTIKTELATIQEQVVLNEHFKQDMLAIFPHSQINGMENRQLYRFLAQPVTKNELVEVSDTLNYYPYILTIISGVLSCVISYYFFKRTSPKWQLAKRDWQKMQATYLGIMTICTTVIAMIIAIVSGYFSQFTFAEYVKLTAILSLVLNGMTHFIYLALAKIRQSAIGVIFATMIYYLIMHQLTGTLLQAGTFWQRLNKYSLFAMSERGLHSLLIKQTVDSDLQVLLIFYSVAFIGCFILSIVLKDWPIAEGDYHGKL